LGKFSPPASPSADCYKVDSPSVISLIQAHLSGEILSCSGYKCWIRQTNWPLDGNFFKVCLAWWTSNLVVC